MKLTLALLLLSTPSFAYFDYCHDCSPEDKATYQAQKAESQKIYDDSQAIINAILAQTDTQAINHTLIDQANQRQNDQLQQIIDHPGKAITMLCVAQGI